MHYYEVMWKAKRGELLKLNREATATPFLTRMRNGRRWHGRVDDLYICARRRSKLFKEQFPCITAAISQKRAMNVRCDLMIEVSLKPQREEISSCKSNRKEDSGNAVLRYYTNIAQFDCKVLKIGHIFTYPL